MLRAQRHDDEGDTNLRIKPNEDSPYHDIYVRDDAMIEYLSESVSPSGTTYYLIRDGLNVGYMKADYCVRLTLSDHFGGRKA